MSQHSATVLVTGGAGFIGSHLADHLISSGYHVTVLDNFNSFYDPDAKRANIKPHLNTSRYTLCVGDICDLEFLRTQLSGDFDIIVHLAAMAGVRPSIADPVYYQKVNVEGTQNLLEMAREWGVPKFVFGSSSSVYGINENVPWREDDHVLKPISPYASTKISGELLGHVYSALYGISFTALRFFTVYGPRQRPDLAIHKFARLMMSHEPIPIYGDGSTRRDYTYVGDIVRGIVAAMHYSGNGFEIINLGNNRTVGLAELIDALELALDIKAIRKHVPEQPGDVPRTWANIERANKLLSYYPETSIEDGLTEFVAWLRAD